MTNTTKNDLPQQTTDLNLAKAHLDEFGYCLLANALPPKQVEALRTRLVEQAAAENRKGLLMRIVARIRTAVSISVFGC